MDFLEYACMQIGDDTSAKATMEQMEAVRAGKNGSRI